MILFIVLAILITPAPSAAANGCELPDALTGQWDNNVAGWTSLTITNTTISTLKPESRNLTFSCYMNNGTTYVIQSTPLSVGGMTYNFYTCLDIEPSATSTDIVFFRIRTKNNPNHNNQPFHTVFANSEKTFEGICDRNATAFPLGYTMFLRKGYENNLGNETCPGSLQGVFSANFTDSMELAKCPEGFELNGCDHSHITFNYTQCGSGSNLASSGSPVYMCLTSVKKGDVTYTLTVLQGTSQQQPNPYQYACLAQEKGQDGQMNITKSANECGGSPSVGMEATETVSCRSPAPATTVAPPGSGNTTQASFNTTQGNSTGGGGQGNGGSGDGNGSCSFASWGILSFFLPALVSVLLAGKM